MQLIKLDLSSFTSFLCKGVWEEGHSPLKHCLFKAKKTGGLRAAEDLF